jgi:hypothetical protein
LKAGLHKIRSGMKDENTHPKSEALGQREANSEVKQYIFN